LRDADGAIGVVAYTEGGGCYLAEAEEAEAFTRKLDAQIGRLKRRLVRRQEATRRLPRRQATNGTEQRGRERHELPHAGRAEVGRDGDQITPDVFEDDELL
jgi:hypothetical protein